MEPEHLFVYGTLMRAGSAFHLVSPWVQQVDQARVSGYLLLDLGLFPAAWPAAGRRIAGELLTLRDPARALASLDDYEGCPDPYRRERADAQLMRGGQVSAWIYVLNREPEASWPVLPGERWEPR